MGKTTDYIKVGGISKYIPKKMQVIVKGDEIHLSLTEFNILKLLAINKNLVISKEKKLWKRYGGVITMKKITI